MKRIVVVIRMINFNYEFLDRVIRIKREDVYCMWGFDY